MKLREFYSIDLAEKAYYSLHADLENAKLLENSNDYNSYSEFVDSEKLYAAPNMNYTDDYYPLYLRAAPVANHIRGEYLKNPAKYVREENQRLVFNTQNGIDIKFPMDIQIGDGRIDLFVYQSLHSLTQFLSALNLKFSGWNVSVSNVSI